MDSVTSNIVEPEASPSSSLNQSNAAGPNFLTPIVAKDPDTNEILLVYRSALHCGMDLNISSTEVMTLCRSAEGGNIVQNIKLQFYDGPRLRFDQNRIPADRIKAMEEPLPTAVVSSIPLVNQSAAPAIFTTVAATTAAVAVAAAVSSAPKPANVPTTATTTSTASIGSRTVVDISKVTNTANVTTVPSRKRKIAGIAVSDPQPDTTAPVRESNSVKNANSIKVTPPVINTHGVSPRGYEQYALHLQNAHHILFEILQDNHIPPEGLKFEELIYQMGTRVPLHTLKTDRIRETLDNLVAMKLVVNNAGRYFKQKFTSPSSEEWFQEHEATFKMSAEELETIVDEHNVVGWLVQLMKQCSSHASFRLAFFKVLFDQVSDLPIAFKSTSVNLLGATMMALNKAVNLKVIAREQDGYNLNQTSLDQLLNSQQTLTTSSASMQSSASATPRNLPTANSSDGTGTLPSASPSTGTNGIEVFPPIIDSKGVSRLGYQECGNHRQSTHHVIFEILQDARNQLGLTFQQLLELVREKKYSVKVGYVREILDDLVARKLVVVNAIRFCLRKIHSHRNQEWVRVNDVALKTTPQELERLVDNYNVVGWLVQLMRQCASHSSFRLPILTALVKQVSNFPPVLLSPSVYLLGVIMMALNKGVNMKIFQTVESGYSLTPVVYTRYPKPLPDIGTSAGTSSLGLPVAPSVFGVGSQSKSGVGATSSSNSSSSRVLSVVNNTAADKSNPSSSKAIPDCIRKDGSGPLSLLAADFYREKEELMRLALEESGSTNRAVDVIQTVREVVTPVVEEIEASNMEVVQQVDTPLNVPSRSEVHETNGNDGRVNESANTSTSASNVNVVDLNGVSSYLLV